MNLVLSDRKLPLFDTPRKDTEFVDLSGLKISGCMGCFGCWTKTPGRCVIRDDAVRVYPLIAASERVLYISRILYGGYDTVMKTMLERSIPVQQAFIRLLHGETHHVQRDVRPKSAVIIAYGAPSPAEQQIFERLVERNAANMCFSDYRVVFATEDEVACAAEKEAAAWEK